MEVSRRGLSSAETTVSPPFVLSVTGAISASNRPASCAASARWWLCSEKASWSSRLTLSLIATRSAWVPMWQPSRWHHRPSWTVESSSCALPSRSPKRAPGTRNGAWFIDSMPPATTISASPALISAAASMIDLRPEPQTRLMVVAGVVSGRPALRSACRAGACPTPACSTWPIRTSSTTASGGSPRSTAALIATAPSSTAGTVDSAPPNLPIGVRAALTM
jgi:hypothetical protein